MRRPRSRLRLVSRKRLSWRSKSLLTSAMLSAYSSRWLPPKVPTSHSTWSDHPIHSTNSPLKLTIIVFCAIWRLTRVLWPSSSARPRDSTPWRRSEPVVAPPLAAIVVATARALPLSSRRRPLRRVSSLSIRQIYSQPMVRKLRLFRGSMDMAHALEPCSTSMRMTSSISSIIYEGKMELA